MKNMKHLYWAFVGMLAFSSCIDDFLDKKPLDIITEDVVWQDATLMDAYLVNLYRGTSVLTQDASGLVNGWGTDALSSTGNWDREFNNSAVAPGPQWLNQLADEAKTGWIYGASTDGFKCGGISINGGLLEYWEAPYKVIRSLNMFIERVPLSNVDDEFKTKRIAEARFLRAFNYFAMVKRYGGVPLITKVLQLDGTEEELYPKRNTEQEIYDFIISEMNDISGMENADGANDTSDDLTVLNDVGRSNRWAALALQCRAALYAGSIAQFGTMQKNGLVGIPSSAANAYYEVAYKAALKIKEEGGYSLFNNYPDDKVKNFRQLFIEKNHSEAIMVVQHDGLDAIQSTGNGWSWDFLECPHPQSWGAGNASSPYLEFAEDFENIDGSSGKLDRQRVQQGEWSINELWGKKEPRFWATLWTQDQPWKGITVDFCPGGIQNPNGNDFKTGFGVLKYLDENANNMEWLCRSSTDYMVFRYGEVLLNLAEAAFELGKTDEALDAINDIRERAGLGDLASVTREDIRHERKIELAFEGHRYWDLRRWRIATSVINGTNYSGIRYDYGSQPGKYKITILENVHGTTNTRFEESNYYFPITLGRTGANPNLEENPGYN